MIASIPTHCPHGAAHVVDLQRLGVHETAGARYADECWTAATATGPRVYWCGRGAASLPDGVSVTAGEYLAAWGEALIEDAHAEALEDGVEVGMGLPRPARGLRRVVDVDDDSHPDTEETREYLRALYTADGGLNEHDAAFAAQGGSSYSGAVLDAIRDRTPTTLEASAAYYERHPY